MVWSGFLISLVVAQVHHDSREPAIDLVLLSETEEAHGVAEVNSIAWSPLLPSSPTQQDEQEERKLASAGDDGVVKVWRVSP